MICRLWRQIKGRTRRAAEAEAIHRRQMDEARYEIALSSQKVEAVDQLVKQFQKDVSQWPLS